ncbi:MULTISPECIES: AraC family transcriptional regulator, partial [Cupriavidus]|uniref:Helix-turn-helix-domain-containing protein AraC type n=1 Tax=Cupriavidus taiwanensis TaxID=164546 RepID=A0A375JC46_9BURK
MFLTFYFPLAASLSVPNVPESFLNKICDGNLNAAAAQASSWLDISKTVELIGLRRLYADIQMTIGVCDEAEEHYRSAQKAMRSGRHALRTASCRNAAWQALFRHRLAMALTCFARLVDDPQVEPAQRVETQLGIVGALHQLGQSRYSSDALDELAIAISDPSLCHWHEIVVTLRYDIAVQRELRNATILCDHAYWRSGLGDHAMYSGVATDGIDSMPSASDEADRHEAEALDVSGTLLRHRVKYLWHLRALARGEAAAIGGITAHLNWAQRSGFGAYLQSTRIEAVLAAITAKKPQLAEILLEPLHRMGLLASTCHRQIEYLYAFAKTHQELGRSREAMLYFSRYALVFARSLRDDSKALVSYACKRAEQAPQLDDVAVRLPARYRRAYRYLLQNLDKRDLSVRELAAEVDVTERALQSAFKQALGLSPTELIRQLRMERIRTE